jgi:hypothetical protein
MVLLPFWQTCGILRERPKSCQRAPLADLAGQY